MRQSWDVIRAKAASFADEWATEQYEKREAQSFYNDFFEIFGVRRRKVASFELPVKKLGNQRGYIDLFWKGVLLVEHKSGGRDLTKAKLQALDYFPGLRDHELPRYILVCDFQNFQLTDLETGEDWSFKLAELPKYVELFGFIMGIEKRIFRDQDPVNIIAAELMGKLHDSLKDGGYEGPPLERLLVRLMFCLFADDTGIFPERDMFESYILDRTAEDGHDLGAKLNLIFQVLDTPESSKLRTSLDSDLCKFPYINGDLFKPVLPIANFNADMRKRLLEACGFGWEKISPAIFGALFQSVMNAKERRQKGAHYTTEKNILKVISPLFLDDLKSDFSRILGLKRGREAALREFQGRLAGLKFFDPACGCGNFLIITYRELRLLEIDVLKALYPSGQLDLEATALSKVDVDQFYGIEIDEFAARIAETALWMMDHIMNNRLSQEFGQVFARIPLKATPHIHGGPEQGDALEIKWDEILDPKECSYIFGNPPFIGSKQQSNKQRNQVKKIATISNAGGTLDYVAAWFLKAAAYSAGTKIRIGFVSTNSITQGEQVSQLWPALFDRYGLEISFAHRTFGWGSDARGVANVHVVIIGLCHRIDEPVLKRLFSYEKPNSEPVESAHNAISPYLIDVTSLDNRHLVVKSTRKRPEGVPELIIGSKPVDGGYFIIEAGEEDGPLAKEARSAGILHPYFGSEEMLNGGDRWIVTPFELDVAEIRNLPELRAAIGRVKAYRLGQLPPRKNPEGENKKATDGSTALAETPARFHVTVVPSRRFLCIPKVSSETRRYIPSDLKHPPHVPSDLVFVAEGAEDWLFALVSSAMHMSWTSHIGGRLESRYRYSGGISYNAFPWPVLTETDKERLSELARTILSERAGHPNATLADLYDPDLMPDELRKAHRTLDQLVDRIYHKTGFASDRERVEYLLTLYEKREASLLAMSKSRGRKRKA